MKTLEDIFKKLQDLDYDISKILKDSTYEQYDDFSELEIDYKDSEQLFMLDELRIIMNRMEEVHNRVRYLSAPVEEQARYGSIETSVMRLRKVMNIHVVHQLRYL